MVLQIRSCHITLEMLEDRRMLSGGSLLSIAHLVSPVALPAVVQSAVSSSPTPAITNSVSELVAPLVPAAVAPMDNSIVSIVTPLLNSVVVPVIADVAPIVNSVATPILNSVFAPLANKVVGPVVNSLVAPVVNTEVATVATPVINTVQLAPVDVPGLPPTGHDVTSIIPSLTSGTAGAALDAGVALPSSHSPTTRTPTAPLPVERAQAASSTSGGSSDPADMQSFKVDETPIVPPATQANVNAAPLTNAVDALFAALTAPVGQTRVTPLGNQSSGGDDAFDPIEQTGKGAGTLYTSLGDYEPAVEIDSTDAAALEMATLTPSTKPDDDATLEVAVQQFLKQLGEGATEVAAVVRHSSVNPWIIAAIAAACAGEWARRQWRRSPTESATLARFQGLTGL